MVWGILYHVAPIPHQSLRCVVSKESTNEKRKPGGGVKIIAAKKKRECLKRHKALAKACQMKGTGDVKAACNDEKPLAKLVVWQAKSVAEWESSGISHKTTLGTSNLPCRWTKQIKMLAKNVLGITLVICLSVMRRKRRLGLNTTLDY